MAATSGPLGPNLAAMIQFRYRCNQGFAEPLQHTAYTGI